MTHQSEHRLVLCTCPDQDTALAIAGQVVERRLAACVSLVPGLTSVYRWQGSLHRDPELLLLIKTTADRFESLSETLRELHPYDVPEIIALPIAAGSPDYLSWVTRCTRPDD